MIDRKMYMSKLMDFKDKGVIKIITGIRRCREIYIIIFI